MALVERKVNGWDNFTLVHSKICVYIGKMVLNHCRCVCVCVCVCYTSMCSMRRELVYLYNFLYYSPQMLAYFGASISVGFITT